MKKNKTITFSIILLAVGIINATAIADTISLKNDNKIYLGNTDSSQTIAVKELAYINPEPWQTGKGYHS
jgi:hypothetical protein